MSPLPLDGFMAFCMHTKPFIGFIDTSDAQIVIYRDMFIATDLLRHQSVTINMCKIWQRNFPWSVIDPYIYCTDKLTGGF